VRSRLVLVVALFLGLTAGGVGGASAIGANRTAATGDWGCVVVRTINQGICLSNPLPERLPLPN
jgi:hypothetical protein